MTRHPWSTRLLRAFLALWFVLSGGELGLVHACPQHSHAGGVAHVHGVAPGSGMHAGHQGSPHVAGHHEERAPGQPGPCTCVGDCSAAPMAAALGEAPSVRVQGVVRIAAAALPDVVIAPAVRGAHVLPFGNGPPAGLPTA